jgi:hypothetical protein
MEYASLVPLVAELLTTVHLLSGYPTVSVLPEVHRLPQSAIAEKVCHKPCGVRAYYRPDWGVLLDESLNVEADSFDRSILLHELVHHVQAAQGRFDTMPNACDRWNAAEREAYAVQNLFLAGVHSAKHVAMSAWVARCDGTDLPNKSMTER